MTLLIDLSLGLGTYPTVGDDLLQITRCDPGLSSFQPTEFVLQVTYTPKKAATAPSNLLLAIVDAPVNVLVVGVGSTYVLSNGTAISEKAGVIQPGDLVNPITIWYDITDAGGKHWLVEDANSQKVHLPRAVLVFHELAHAFHMIQGDYPATSPEREVQAIRHENEFRSVVELPLRHSSSHEGFTGIPDHGGLTFPTCTVESTPCPTAVAAEALGSPHAPDLDALRSVRRRYKDLSAWCTLASGPILDLYPKFSPAIVHDMRRDEELRCAIFTRVVQPLFGLREIVERFLDDQADDAGVVAMSDEVLDRYLAALDPAALTTLSEAAGAAADAGQRLASRSARAGDGLFDYIVDKILAADGDATGFAWGFAGLALFLRRAAERARDGGGVSEEFLLDFGDWLARPPIPPGADLSQADPRAELIILREHVFTRPHMRHAFARHLLGLWPSRAAPELRALLSELSYMGAGNRR